MPFCKIINQNFLIMKKNYLFKTMLLLCALIVGSTSSVWAESVTYLISSKNTLTVSGTAPTGSSATILETYGTSQQMTSGNSQTLTLKGYNGCKITQLALRMRSNASGGAGKLSYSTDAGTTYTYLVGSTSDGVSFNKEAWNGSYTNNYVTITKSGLNIECGASDVKIKIEATDNSLYCQSYEITYSPAVVEPLPSHTATFSVNGDVTRTATVEEGALVPFPTAVETEPGEGEFPKVINGKTFVGWYTSEYTHATDAPSFVDTASENMGTADVMYYAVYATVTTSGTLIKITDELTRSTTGVTGTTYKDWSNKKSTSDAVYAGSSAGGNSAIQLRDSGNSGIITTTSGGKVKKVVVTWNGSTSDDRVLDIYGKNTAYSAVSELYDSSTRGTKLGSISKKNQTELTIDGDYEYIGLRSKSGAMYLTSISIDWQTGTPASYSDYSTTVSVKLNAYGYATFSSAYPVDFSDAEDYTAWQITDVDETTIKFEQVTGAVKGGTGLLLKGEANAEVTLQYADSDIELTDNQLVAITTPTNVEANEYYGLSGKSFVPVTSAGVVKAGKALLSASAIPSEARQLTFVFDEGGTTAVDVRGKMEDVRGDFFNIAGQRVANPTKGLYIVNGKKVVIK